MYYIWHTLCLDFAFYLLLVASIEMSFYLSLRHLDFRVLELQMRTRNLLMTWEVEKMKLGKRVSKREIIASVAGQMETLVLTGTKIQLEAVELQKSPQKRRP